MNDLSQAPKVNLALNALLANMFRVADDPYLSPAERVDLMVQTALRSNVVAKAGPRTILATLEPAPTDNGRMAEEWVPCPREALDEQIVVTLKDGRTYAFSLGFPR